MTVAVAAVFQHQAPQWALGLGLVLRELLLARLAILVVGVLQVHYFLLFWSNPTRRCTPPRPCHRLVHHLGLLPSEVMLALDPAVLSGLGSILQCLLEQCVLRLAQSLHFVHRRPLFKSTLHLTLRRAWNS
mmetsp:Transcript_166674/g.529687  ORF Transcript_166674/g.529687 Transcript_166674/m.529687 type:complete len:131 (+) Transcript_166674:718-1110(+)